MKAIEWLTTSVRFIDQTKLPFEEVYITTDDYNVICDGIRTLGIRGAPLIGVAAAYGVALASLKVKSSSTSEFRLHVLTAINELASSRPTAVNLFWALSRMEKVLSSNTDISKIREALINEAFLIHREDAEMCRLMGLHGADLIPKQATILTICNTGALATGGEGTAQSVITTAHNQGKAINVFACETRPALQGARLTTWELMNAGVDVTLITDSMAATLMKRKHVDCVITGSDRIASNGDAANKIGTYNLAVLAHYHSIPFYIAAPSSTIDKTISNGNDIPIEERDPQEVLQVFGTFIASPNVKVWNPSFDMTPAELITAIITEKGIHLPPYTFPD